MRKLTLNPEHLAVESFETASPGRLPGTVHAAQDVAEPVEPTEPEPVSAWTCQTYCGQATCGATCYTCFDATCNSCYATRCYTGNSPECCA